MSNCTLRSVPDPNEPDPAASSTDDDPGAIIVAKRELRREMRVMRLALPDRPERSERIVEHLVMLDDVRRARRLLAYDSVPGEVETKRLVDWCRHRGVEVAMPEDPDLDPTWPDVIVVPGTAFTRHGARIGQGGGWYDRFLPERRTDAFTVGIGFGPQLVEWLPVEPHDVELDCIVTEDGAVFPDAR